MQRTPAEVSPFFFVSQKKAALRSAGRMLGQTPRLYTNPLIRDLYLEEDNALLIRRQDSHETLNKHSSHLP